MKLLNGSYDFASGKLTDTSSEVFIFENDSAIVRVLGNARTVDGVWNDGADIVNTYLSKGEGLPECLQGLYLLLIYDKRSQTLYIFQDRTTSPVTLYYTVCRGRCYYSTSLKELLLSSGIPREPDESSIEDFVLNGYIYGSNTLVKSVKKIAAFQALQIKPNEGLKQIPVTYATPEMSKGVALDAWKTTVDNAIIDCLECAGEATLPLSSGYDSSYILHVIHEQKKGVVNAFSIGGKFGKNELPEVKANAGLYGNTNLVTALTDENTLRNLPDIVWRLEGAVYECGCFLQYELSKLVSQNGKKHLICGECADQVMNQWYLDRSRIFPAKDEERAMYYEFSEYPYIFGSFLILKKNGIMTNSFDIEGHYPYLNDNAVAVSDALRLLNGKDKRCHVANCNEVLPEGVIANITKIGGSTDCHSLFNSPEEIKEFMRAVENTAFYRTYAAMLARCSRLSTEKQTGLTALKTAIRNAVLTVLRIGVAGRRQNAYLHEEIKLREYLCYAYIILFKELFLSGKYDNQFNKKGIEVNFMEILKNA